MYHSRAHSVIPHSLSPVLGSTNSRGFVAPNTGDRLCAITECAREWYRIILLYGNIFLFTDIGHSHASSISSDFDYLSR